MSDSKNDVVRKLLKANLAKNLLPPLLVGLSIMIAGGLASLVFSFLAPPAFSSMASHRILEVECLLSLVAALVVYLLRRESPAATAVKIDQELSAKNRLEASFELSQTTHPLKEAQEKEASFFYAKWTLPAWFIWLSLMVILYVCIALGHLVLNIKLEQKALAAKLLEEKAEAMAADKEKTAGGTEKKTECAEMSFIEPEPETRSKPLDEIVWKAKGTSTNGFNAIFLELSVNGELRKDVSLVNAPLKKSGEIDLDGSFLLEDLDVSPFDLVSYNLRATTTLDGIQNREISTPPQFIEIRPYREDAWERTATGDYKARPIDTILRLLRVQIALNKATHAARYSGLDTGDLTLLAQTSQLATDQSSLADATKTLLEEQKDGMTTNMFDCLVKAENDMHDATKQLQGGKANGGNGE